jgi:hypothetical protein
VAASTIAIMQPYFLPYAGYFRLLAATDLLVIYDCVQFPRRGWVHRNRLVDHAGNERWLTLPLQPAPRAVLIRDLRFAENVTEVFAARLRAFSLRADHPAAQSFLLAVREIGGRPVDYIEGLLARAASHLGLHWTTMRSSELGVPASFRGQDRILEIARRLGARTYINPPGGRDLYDRAAFEAAGIDLKFLTDYPGPNSSILTRILHESPLRIAHEIRQATRFQSS